MKSVRLLALGTTALIVGVGVTATLVGSRAREMPAHEDTVVSLPVKVVHPKKGALARRCIQPGSIHTFESIELFAQVPGYLKTQTVDIGDRVKKGEVLARVDVPDLDARLERNAAEVRKQEAQYDQMKARLDVARANLDAADAAVAQSQASAKSATAWVTYRKLQLGRIESLVKARSLEDYLLDESKERYEAAVETEIASKAAIATSKANVVACQAKIKQAESDLAEADAEIKVARAELKKAQVDVDFATVRAPFDGVITYRSMNPGDFVHAANAGGAFNPLLTIHRTDLFRVIVLLPDRDVEFCQPGKPATIEIDSLPGRKFSTVVARIAKALDPNTRLMRVELDLRNPTGQIYHGMYGQVTIVLQNNTNVLSIPYACLAGQPEHGKATIYVVRDGKAKPLRIEMGIDTGVRVAVTRGLSEDDQVILNPSSYLSEEPRVAPTLSKDPSAP